MATATTRTQSGATACHARASLKPLQQNVGLTAHAPARPAANPPTDLQPAPPAAPRPQSRPARPQLEIRRTASQDSICSLDIVTPKDQLMRTEASLEEGPPPILRLAPSRPPQPPPPPPHKAHAAAGAGEEDELQLRDQSISGAPPCGQGNAAAAQPAGRPPKPKVRLVEPPMPVNPYTTHGSRDGRQSFQTADSCHRPEGYSRFLWDYHQESELGQGNFSRVYRAVHRLTGTAFAVKTNRLPISCLQARNMWLNEMQALAAVQGHPHIVALHDAWFEADSRPGGGGGGGGGSAAAAGPEPPACERVYIKMELCGESLGGLVRRRMQLSELAAVDLLRQMASALKRIHELGMLHMDVKPDNIYTAAGRGSLRSFTAAAAAAVAAWSTGCGTGGGYGSGAVYKLGDFGLAMMEGGRRAGVSEGDCRYLAPEALRTRGFLDSGLADRLDIFALGATVYELLRGVELPRNGQEYLDVRAGRIVLPGVDTRLQSLLKKMMSADPTQRPTAEQLLKMPVLAPGGGGSGSGIYQMIRRQSSPVVQSPPPALSSIARRSVGAPPNLVPRPSGPPAAPYYSLAPYQLGAQPLAVGRRSVSCTR